MNCLAVGLGLLLAIFADPEPAPDSLDTLDNFSPKWNLDSIRFVYHNDDNFYFELSQNQEMLCAALNKEFIEKEFMYMEDKLSEDVKARVLARIPESLGDVHTLLFPDLTSIAVTMKSVTLFPWGDGGYRGFLGVAPDERPPHPSSDKSGRVSALAYPGRRLAEAKPVAHSSPEDIDALGRSLVGKHHSLDNQTYLKSFDLSLSDREKVIASHIRTTGDRGVTYMVAFVNVGTGWQSIPWRSDRLAEVVDHVLFENGKSETDYTFVDTELSVYPDIDGNGLSELLVNSVSIAVFFSLERDTRGDTTSFYFREVRHIYFGP